MRLRKCNFMKYSKMSIVIFLIIILSCHKPNDEKILGLWQPDYKSYDNEYIEVEFTEKTITLISTFCKRKRRS